MKVTFPGSLIPRSFQHLLPLSKPKGPATYSVPIDIPPCCAACGETAAVGGGGAGFRSIPTPHPTPRRSAQSEEDGGEERGEALREAVLITTSASCVLTPRVVAAADFLPPGEEPEGMPQRDVTDRGSFLVGSPAPNLPLGSMKMPTPDPETVVEEATEREEEEGASCRRFRPWPRGDSPPRPGEGARAGSTSEVAPWREADESGTYPVSPAPRRAAESAKGLGQPLAAPAPAAAPDGAPDGAVTAAGGASVAYRCRYCSRQSGCSAAPPGGERRARRTARRCSGARLKGGGMAGWLVACSLPVPFSVLSIATTATAARVCALRMDACMYPSYLPVAADAAYCSLGRDLTTAWGEKSAFGVRR